MTQGEPDIEKYCLAIRYPARFSLSERVPGVTNGWTNSTIQERILSGLVVIDTIKFATSLCWCNRLISSTDFVN
jgi:hypothetical protein